MKSQHHSFPIRCAVPPACLTSGWEQMPVRAGHGSRHSSPPPSASHPQQPAPQKPPAGRTCTPASGPPGCLWALGRPPLWVRSLAEALDPGSWRWRLRVGASGLGGMERRAHRVSLLPRLSRFQRPVVGTPGATLNCR